MRSHRIFSLAFVSIFFTLILAPNSSVIAQDLVEINIPAWESVLSESKYTNPTKEFTNQMTQWSETVLNHARFKEAEGKNLKDKREAAKIAAFGPDNAWQGSLIDWLKTTVTKDVATPLADFAKWLVGLSDKIDREQAFAEAAQAVNEHIPVVHDAKVMLDSMFPVAKKVRDNYVTNGGSIDDLDALTPKPDIEIPDRVVPRWYCKANGIGTGLHSSFRTCDETYPTPYEARDDHKLWCGGTKDPTAGVDGCGRPYYSCDEGAVKEHAVLYCNISVLYQPGILPKSLGKCGAPYRECSGSLKSGVHVYRSKTAMGTNSWGFRGSYAVGIESDGLSRHQNGQASPLSNSVNGPNGVGLDSSKYDETPSCDTCIDGSSFCPDGSTNHNDGQANNDGNGGDQANNNGNGNGFGNTINAVCLDAACSTTITASNAPEHALVTCDACGVQYHTCNENAVYSHALVSCRRADCPRKGGTGATNLYQRRRCQPNPSGINNPFSCAGGLPHDFGDAGQGSSTPATVPDRPGSFALTPHRYAIRLTWTSSASNGGSAITDYQYQYQSSRNSRRTWSSWSSWTSAGTGNSTWINGLSSGVDYGIRMRAVNTVGNSSVTGIKIVKTTE